MQRLGLACAAALAAMAPCLAGAGPWSRDPGAVFLSYTASADSDRAALSSGDLDGRLYQSVYGEIGLGRRMTAGIDIGGDRDGALGQAFLRYTFTRNNAPWQVAVDAGAALRSVDGQDDTVLLRLGASVGRGFGAAAVGWVPLFEPDGGWASLDAYALVDPQGGADPIWQAEGTVGLRLTERFTGLMQLKVEEYPGADLAVTVSPSLLWGVGERTSILVGARAGFAGSEEIGLRAGLWQEF